MKILLKKLQIKDKEFVRYLSVVGRIGLNIVVSLLSFFFLFLWLDRRLQTGNVLLIIGIILGVFSGVYLNYKYLKPFYTNEPLPNDDDVKNNRENLS